MTDRRTFLKGITVLPATTMLSTQAGCSPVGELAVDRDYFKELGIRPFINAAAAYSALGGRTMWPAVIDAMEYARNQNVIMEELQEAVGKRLAELVGCEAAMVTGGATSAMTLGTAACITGTNPNFILRVPDLRGLKNEVVVQKSHRNAYDHGVRNSGVHFIEVESAEELEGAINDSTAMMFYVYLFDTFSDEPPKIGLEEFAALGQKHGIPTMIDGSNTVPPLERLSEYIDAGFDLACFSGGKGLRGPYSAGMLLGRQDLIASARLNATPNADTIGRGMKVSKEEVLGMLAAVEFSQKYDYSVENVRETKMVNHIARELSVHPGITTQVSYPATEGGRPHLQIFWDESLTPITIEEAQKELEDGEPSIRTPYLSLSDGQLEIGTAMLKDHETEVVVRRIGEVLAPRRE